VCVFVGGGGGGGGGGFVVWLGGGGVCFGWVGGWCGGGCGLGGGGFCLLCVGTGCVWGFLLGWVGSVGCEGCGFGVFLLGCGCWVLCSVGVLVGGRFVGLCVVCGFLVGGGAWQGVCCWGVFFLWFGWGPNPNPCLWPSRSLSPTPPPLPATISPYFRNRQVLEGKGARVHCGALFM